MDPLDCYTFEEEIDNKNSLTRSQPKRCYKLIDNLRRVGNLISKYKQKSKRAPSQTSQISDPPQGNKALLESVMLYGAEEAKLVERN